MKKFIMTHSVEIKDKLLANGATLVSDNNNVFIFLNKLPQNFCFDKAEITKVAYTNILPM